MAFSPGFSIGDCDLREVIPAFVITMTSLVTHYDTPRHRVSGGYHPSYGGIQFLPQELGIIPGTSFEKFLL